MTARLSAGITLRFDHAPCRIGPENRTFPDIHLAPDFRWMRISGISRNRHIASDDGNHIGADLKIRRNIVKIAVAFRARRSRGTVTDVLTVHVYVIRGNGGNPKFGKRDGGLQDKLLPGKYSDIPRAPAGFFRKPNPFTLQLFRKCPDCHKNLPFPEKFPACFL